MNSPHDLRPSGYKIGISSAKLRNSTGNSSGNNMGEVIRLFPNAHILIHGMTKQKRGSSHEIETKK